ncbi:MAG: HRDC domain-containing protein, partial [Thermoguttaceae bacterium]|nr:HRDC domain-containing protein [Thermoguttaceae bacterium]
RRPLTRYQLEYGLDDVRYLYPMRTIIGGRIEKLGRSRWFEEDMNAWKEKLLWQFSPDRWEKLVLNSTFDQRSLAIVRELFFWRERRAQLADCPVKRILRDDLIIELARRQVSDIDRIKEMRDFAQSNYAGILEPVSDAISHAMRLPKRELPQLMEHDPSSKMTVLGQLLYAALGTICKQNKLACNLVGNPSDVRKWALWRLNPELNISKPILEQGWRKQVVGSVFEELISGNMVIRVADPTSEEPLEFLMKAK